MTHTPLPTERITAARRSRIGHSVAVARDEWQFVADESFGLTGRGTAVFGCVSGDLQGGAGASLHHGDNVTRVEKVSVEWARVEGGERLALVLYGIERDQVPVGAVLRGPLHMTTAE